MGDTDKAIRDEAKHRATEAAFLVPDPCPHCKGEGTVAGTRKVVHSLKGGFGADWDLSKVLAEIDAAEKVEWHPSMFGHDLMVWPAVGGTPLAFAVRTPGKER